MDGADNRLRALRVGVALLAAYVGLMIVGLGVGFHEPLFFGLGERGGQGIDFFCVPKAFSNLLAGRSAWITGLRREQSVDRAAVELESIDAEGRTKLSPLADWTWGDVWHYIALHDVPYNALHDHFYPSIGCAPCTRAIALGEDFRAGRWWWEQEGAKECGLHVAPASTLVATP